MYPRFERVGEFLSSHLYDRARSSVVCSRVWAGEHPAHILERLEFEGIPAGVLNEQGRLFAGFPLETDVGLNDEVHVSLAQFVRQRMPNVPLQDGTEVPDRDVIAVHRIGRHAVCLLRREMRRDLMAEEIEVDPTLALATDATAEQVDVEPASRFQVGNREGKMET